MPMTERNKLLAEAFGHVTHKLSFNEDQIVCSCGAHYNGEGYHDRAYNHVHGINPDYFTLVTLKCDKCGGSGWLPCPEAETRCMHFLDGDCSNVQICMGTKHRREIPCPCQGKPRIISEFQRMVEERGEWDAFYVWAMKRYGVTKLPGIFTDLIKMADAYLEWRKV